MATDTLVVVMVSVIPKANFIRSVKTRRWVPLVRGLALWLRRRAGRGPTGQLAPERV